MSPVVTVMARFRAECATVPIDAGVVIALGAVLKSVDGMVLAK
jgi:hypothetical protein